MERRDHGRAAGQALVELLLTVPLLLLLAAAAMGTLRPALLGPWVDERLECRLLRPEDPDCERAVVSLRRETPFPVYLRDEEASLSFSRQAARRGLSPIWSAMDGGVGVQKAVLRAGKDEDTGSFPEPGPAFAGTVTRRLAMWSCSWPAEDDVRGRVERILLWGLPGRGIFEWIRGAGMDPIRVDLDALPSSAVGTDPSTRGEEP